MKLWLLKPRNKTQAVEYFSWDCNLGFVVRADSPSEARKIASKKQSDEGDEVWLDPSITSCRQLKSLGPKGVVLTDYRSA